MWEREEEPCGGKLELEVLSNFKNKKKKTYSLVSPPKEGEAMVPHFVRAHLVHSPSKEPGLEIG